MFKGVVMLRSKYIKVEYIKVVILRSKYTKAGYIRVVILRIEL